MTRYTQFFLAATCLLVANLPAFAEGETNKSRQEDVRKISQLAVQMALVQGQRHMARGDVDKAVAVLESQLSRINGNRVYLALLRDAYRAFVVRLHLKNQPKSAAKYLYRLSILDPDAANELSARSANTIKNARLTAGQENKTDKKIAKPTQPRSKFRANLSEEKANPFAIENSFERINSGAKARLAKQALADAEKKYRSRLWEDARLLYRRAYQTDPQVIEFAKDRWAYCKLKHVVRELNKGEARSQPLKALENEVKIALSLSRQLQPTGKMVLEQIAKRRDSKAPPPKQRKTAPPISVRHHAQPINSWHVAESAHFRVFHRRPKDYAERVTRIAEQTRSTTFDKWFGSTVVPWRHKCDIYLHADGNAYSRATGVPSQSPGHSRIETDKSSGAVVSLRVELRCDNPDMLKAILPHETTHVVLAGQFGRHAVPRWVDEGIAVLSEPADKIEQHRRNLYRFSLSRELFRVKDLMALKNYPRPRQIGAFYAQSVSLVEFLSGRRGPQVFTQFVRDGLRNGYQSALQKHYGWREFSKLEQSWTQIALREFTSAGGGLAIKNPAQE